MGLGSRVWLENVLPRVAQVCLIVLPTAYGLGFWQWHKTLESRFAEPTPVAVEIAEEPRVDHEKLVALFGSAREETSAAPVKESTLALKLVASYVAGKQGRSAAVIASGESNHRLHYQGDKVLPGVELVAVQARRILIKRNGVLESVSLEENRRSDSSRAAATPRSSNAPLREKPLSRQELTEKLSKLKSLASGEL